MGLVVGPRRAIVGDVGVCNSCLAPVRITEGGITAAGRLSDWDQMVLEITRDLIRRRSTGTRASA